MRVWVGRASVVSIALLLATWAQRSSAADAATIRVLVAFHSGSGNTEKMAQGVAEGAKRVAGSTVVMKRIGDVVAEDLTSADAVVLGSPVYFANMSGEMKTFLDSWLTKFGLYQDKKMRNKVGGAFATGAAPSNGKEVTVLAMLNAMLINQMVVASGGGGFGATATTGPDSPGIDEKEIAEARSLGQRIAELAGVVRRGTAK